MKILAFGRLKEIVGSSVIELDGTASVQELRNALISRFPSLVSEVFSVAVNKVVVSGDYKIENDSEVALLPPFSGG